MLIKPNSWSQKTASQSKSPFLQRFDWPGGTTLTTLNFLVCSAPDVTFLKRALQPNPGYCVCMVVGDRGKKGKRGGTGCFSSAEETLLAPWTSLSLGSTTWEAGQEEFREEWPVLCRRGNSPKAQLVLPAVPASPDSAGGWLCLSAVASGLLSLLRRGLSNPLMFSSFPCTSLCPSKSSLPPLCESWGNVRAGLPAKTWGAQDSHQAAHLPLSVGRNSPNCSNLLRLLSVECLCPGQSTEI